MQWIVIGVVLVFTLRTLTVWLRASKYRPDLISSLQADLNQVHDAVALLDELVHKYPLWRHDEQLVLHAKLVEEVGNETTRQLIRMVFGMPLVALARLDVLSYVLDEGVSEFAARAEERFPTAASRTQI